MRKQIKIIKASDDLFWYSNLIGQTLPVVREEYDRYWCREKNPWQCLNFVLKTDCEEIRSISDESEVVDACKDRSM